MKPKSNYEQLIKESKSNSGAKYKNTTLIIAILLIIIINSLCFILLFLQIKVRDVMITNYIKRKKIDDLSLDLKSLLTKIINEESKIKDIIHEKESHINTQTMYSQRLTVFRNKRTNLIKKRDDRQYSSNLAKTLSSFLTYKQIEQTESMTNCTFISNCYRMTRDGMSAKAFHHNCNSLKPTIALIKATNKAIFGGITYQSWEGTGMKYDNKAYLFSLVVDIKFHLKEGQPAINTSGDLLPTFGKDDLYVSETEAYVNHPMISYGTITSKNIEKNYLILEEIEVYHMKCSDS